MQHRAPPLTLRRATRAAGRGDECAAAPTRPEGPKEGGRRPGAPRSPLAASQLWTDAAPHPAQRRHSAALSHERRQAPARRAERALEVVCRASPHRGGWTPGSGWTPGWTPGIGAGIGQHLWSVPVRISRWLPRGSPIRSDANEPLSRGSGAAPTLLPPPFTATGLPSPRTPATTGCCRISPPCTASTGSNRPEDHAHMEACRVMLDRTIGGAAVPDVCRFGATFRCAGGSR